MIYIIKKLWIDPLENDWNRAQGYEIIGYIRADDESIPKKYCEGAGVMIGTGWPFERDQEVPNLIYEPVEELAVGSRQISDQIDADVIAWINRNNSIFPANCKIEVLEWPEL